MGRKSKRKKTFGDYILSLVLLIAIAVFCFAGYNLFRIYMEYKKGTDEYAALEELAVTEREPDAAAEEEGSEGQVVKPPIEVNFSPLKSVNEDVIGWLYMEAIPEISYPVVHGEDNEYYLHRTYEGTYNFAGTIFVDYENKGDFSDCNTLVYGHNMQNGSMFGKLKRFQEQDVMDASRYFWILTPDRNYRYEIFAAYNTAVNSETYTLFLGPGQEFLDYANTMKKNTQIYAGNVEFAMTDRIVTLSTCTGNESTRFVVQGKLVDDVSANNMQ